MLSKSLEEAFNRQLNAELYSAYLYLSMASYFDSINLSGFSNWMKVQAQEELSHAMLFYQHLYERGTRAKMMAIEAPPTDWESPLSVFEHALSHEEKVSGLINQLMELAEKEKDYPSRAFLEWFVKEQIEEEASARDLVERLKLVKDSPRALLILDQQLGQRTFTPPAELTGK